MPVARLNRGLLILGAVTTLLALADAYFSGVFYVLFTCFDSCLNVGAAIASGQISDLTALVVPLAALAPALGVTLGCWIWELLELRRHGATRIVRIVWLFPLITLAVMVSVTLLTSLGSGGIVALYGTNVWYGALALPLWPALVTLVALLWRDARPPVAPEGHSPGGTG